MLRERTVVTFGAPLAATAVGSFPFKDADTACDLILEQFPQIPLWPQLPAASPREQMEIQFSEGLPCCVVDDEKRRMYVDTSGDASVALEAFYENYLAGNLSHFAISDGFSRGIGAMEQRLRSSPPATMVYLKMQVTGPVSFGLTIVDENKRAIYYNEIFRDVVVKGLAMKARWQMRRFGSICKNRICVIDEPILSAFGSSTYVSVHRADVVAQIREVADAIHEEGGLAGIHCCGNTEWSIPVDAGVDMINFDAFEYGESIALYVDCIRSFVEKGGVLAWGIVPTSERIAQETTDSLVSRYETLVDLLASKGIDRTLLLRNSLITASCGTGSVPVERARRIVVETRRVSDRLKERHAGAAG